MINKHSILHQKAIQESSVKVLLKCLSRTYIHTHTHKLSTFPIRSGAQIGFYIPIPVRNISVFLSFILLEIFTPIFTYTNHGFQFLGHGHTR